MPGIHAEEGPDLEEALGPRAAVGAYPLEDVPDLAGEWLGARQLIIGTLGGLEGRALKIHDEGTEKEPVVAPPPYVEDAVLQERLSVANRGEASRQVVLHELEDRADVALHHREHIAHALACLEEQRRDHVVGRRELRVDLLEAAAPDRLGEGEDARVGEREGVAVSVIERIPAHGYSRFYN